MKYNTLALSVSVLALSVLGIAAPASAMQQSYTTYYGEEDYAYSDTAVIKPLPKPVVSNNPTKPTSGPIVLYDGPTKGGGLTTPKDTGPIVLYDGPTEYSDEVLLGKIPVPKNSFKVNKDGSVMLTDVGQKAFRDYAKTAGTSAISQDDFANQLYHNDYVAKNPGYSAVYASSADDTYYGAVKSQPAVLYDGPTKPTPGTIGSIKDTLPIISTLPGTVGPNVANITGGLLQVKGDNKTATLKSMGVDTNALEKALVSQGTWNSYMNGTLSSNDFERAMVSADQWSNFSGALKNPSGDTQKLLTSALGGKNPFAALGSTMTASGVSSIASGAAGSYLTSMTGLTGSGILGDIKSGPKISTSFGGSAGSILTGITGGSISGDSGSLSKMAASYANMDSFLDFKKKQATPPASGSGGLAGGLGGLSGSIKLGGVTLTGGVGAGGLTGGASLGGTKLAGGSFGTGGLSGGFGSGSSMCAYGSSCAGDVVSSFPKGSDGLGTIKGTASGAIAAEKAVGSSLGFSK